MIISTLALIGRYGRIFHVNGCNHSTRNYLYNIKGEYPPMNTLPPVDRYETERYYASYLPPSYKHRNKQAGFDVQRNWQRSNCITQHSKESNEGADFTCPSIHQGLHAF